MSKRQKNAGDETAADCGQNSAAGRMAALITSSTSCGCGGISGMAKLAGRRIADIPVTKQEKLSHFKMR